MKGKKMPVIGASLWILGLALFLIGMNIRTNAGTWMSVIGNVCFFLGLGIEGAVWMKNRGDSSEKKNETEKSGN